MAHTGKKQEIRVGGTVNIRVEKWAVQMVIKDAKYAYGVSRILVSPVEGEGEAWVDCARVIADPCEEKS